MANGHAALLQLPQAPSAPEQCLATGDKPSINLEILGQAVADATCALAAGMISYYRQGGTLDPAVKETGGERLAAVARLMLDHPGDDADFLQVARDAGQRVLRRRHFTDDCYGPFKTDVAISVCLDGLFEIVTRVVRDERIFRIARAN
jgi:hypothetical protein